MFIRHLNDCEEFMGGDGAVLREIFNPDKENLSLRYSLAHAIVKSDESSVKHKMKTSEVYYIMEGEGLMHIENEERKVAKGDTVYIPPNSAQYIKNTGDCDLKFICIVDPAWKKEDEEVL